MNERPHHTELGECTSSCRRVGCPQEKESDFDRFIKVCPLKGRMGQCGAYCFHHPPKMIIIKPVGIEKLPTQTNIPEDYQIKGWIRDIAEKLNEVIDHLNNEAKTTQASTE